MNDDANDDASRPAAGSRRGFRLLPPDRYLGWTPYAWLVYLAGFLVEPVVRTSAGEAGVGVWAATGLGIAIFLATYFRGYWERGPRLLAIIAVQVALGAAYAPFNGGSFVFFLYAAAFAAYVEPPRAAWRVLAAITLAVAATIVVVDVSLYIWIATAVFAPILGGVNLHFAQVRKADAQLRLAQEEIRHLAAVAERERIARDLHDVLGHTLSLIVIKSELAAKLVERDAGRAVREIRDVERVSRDALREVREAIGGYRASFDDEVARSRSMLSAAGVRAEVDVAPDPDGRRDGVDGVLALALREAVTNVVRHARADSCRVRVAAGDEAYVLDVEDDGRGFDATEGGGLRGMRERVRSLGGTVEIGPATPRGGTRVRVALPVDGQGAAALTGTKGA